MARLHTLGNFEKDKMLDKLNDQGYLEIEGNVSVDMFTLIQHRKICQARKLKLGTSLPTLPVKMTYADAERRLVCLRDLPKASVTLLKFEVEATALQNWVQVYCAKCRFLFCDVPRGHPPHLILPNSP